MIRKTNNEDPRYKIDNSRSVEVYKNLHKNCYSIKQDGLVKGHTHELSLLDCTFHVNKKGRDRVRKKKCKEVHAWVKGRISEDFDAESMPMPKFDDKVHYDPYLHDEFMTLHGTYRGADHHVTFVPIKETKIMILKPEGMWKFDNLIEL